MSDSETFMGERLVSAPPNTLHPNQAGYQRRDPHPDDAYQPSPVTVRAITTNGTAAENGHAAMMHAATAFQKHIETTNAERHRYSDQGYREQVDMFKTTDAARAVDAAVEQVKARRDQAQAQIDTVRRSLNQPGDAAQESRNSRFWARTKGVLDTIENGGLLGAAEELLANADRAELSVLAEELTSYLKSRGSVAELTDKRTGEKRDLIDGALARVVPEYAAAQARFKKAHAAVLFTESAANHLKRSFESGAMPDLKVLEKLNPNTAGRLAIDLRGTLPADNGGKYDPDK